MTEATSLNPLRPEPTGVDAGAQSGPVNRRGGTLYFAGALISQVSALLRYVVLARLLGPEQLGIAATLVVTAAFFDLISDTGSDRFVIQDRDGGTVEVQNLVQAVAVGRGLIISLSLLALAQPLARFYGTPRLAMGLSILAITPLISGFAHLDNRRVQRDHDFRPEAISNTLGEFCGFVVTVVAAWLIRDFTAILYGIIARAMVMTVTSHLQAKRAFGIGWSPAHWRRLATFAAPLLLNGLMVFVSQQGDRVVVGQQLGAKALGYYSAVMLLIYYPSVLVVRYLFAINIPIIASHRDRPIERDRAIDSMGGQTLLLAIGMAAGFAVVGPVVVPILFGHRFAQAALLVGLIGCLQTTRFLLNWPTTVALAAGRTTTVLLSNTAHGFAFAGAFIGLRVVGGLAGLVEGFIVGEAMAVAVAVALVNRWMNRSLFNRFDRLGSCLAVYGLIVGWNRVVSAESLWLGAAMAGATIAVAAWIVYRERDALMSMLSLVRRFATGLFLRLKRR